MTDQTLRPWESGRELTGYEPAMLDEIERLRYCVDYVIDEGIALRAEVERLKRIIEELEDPHQAALDRARREKEGKNGL